MDPWIMAPAAAAVVFTAAWAASVYNHLVRLWTRCDHAFAQIEVQLKRRHDLIPNLVACVRGAMQHERETLERVIAARDQAAAMLREAARRPEDRDALTTWMGAEGMLAGALGRLSVALEGYPDLKANDSVAALMEQLTTTENRIAYARQAYNDWATGFNDDRQAFPTCVLGALFGFDRDRGFVEFPDREKLAEAPRVALA